MKLLPNELELVTSNENKIILTNHRIQMTDSVWGQSFFISIFLEDISSIETKYKSNLLFLILAVLFVLGGIFAAVNGGGGGQGSGGGGTFIAGLIIGGIFFALWWFTRKHVISIGSNGGASLNFMVQGMGNEKINDFVHKVSLAKQTRVNQLFKQ